MQQIEEKEEDLPGETENDAIKKLKEEIQRLKYVIVILLTLLVVALFVIMYTYL